MKTGYEPILLFDGDCHFCDQSVQFVIKHDKREIFHFAALQSSFGQQLLTDYNLPTNDFDSFVLITKKGSYTKSTAALHVCLELGGLWRILYLFVFLPRPLRNGIYNFVAKNRYKWFGKKKQCLIPSPEIRKRFLS